MSTNRSPVRDARLTVRRSLRAPRQRVFDAFVRPELRARWWFPEPGMSCLPPEIDARAGGSYRLTMVDDRDAETRHYTCLGEFTEVDPPRRLVFTWRWEHELAAADAPSEVTSRVTVQLEEIDGGTELTITHECLPGGVERDGYAQGWEGCLSRLEELFGDSV